MLTGISYFLNKDVNEEGKLDWGIEEYKTGPLLGNFSKNFLIKLHLTS